MKILITNRKMSSRWGSELYVRDLAIELLRRGHRALAVPYTPLPAPQTGLDLVCRLPLEKKQKQQQHTSTPVLVHADVIVSLDRWRVNQYADGELQTDTMNYR